MFIVNRGVLHAGIGTARVYKETRQRFCQHELKARRLSRWQRGLEVPSFFGDEAIGLAAGCRPCWSCRYEAFLAFKAAWESAAGESVDAAGMDAVLHSAGSLAESADALTYDAQWDSLPDGTFVSGADGPLLVRGETVVPWSQADGYAKPQARPRDGSTRVITPQIIVDVLRAGYVPEMAPSEALATSEAFTT